MLSFVAKMNASTLFQIDSFYLLSSYSSFQENESKHFTEI